MTDPSHSRALDLVRDLLADHDRWRAACTGGPRGPLPPGARDLLRTLSARLAQESTPWPAPGHLAHMTADTPLEVTLAYLCALLYNPNNIAPEASPVTTALEHEVADDLCRLVGHDPTTGWAHLCSGGHAAGYEALWIARNLRGRAVRGTLLYGRNAHYAWEKAADLLGFGRGEVEVVGVGPRHRMDMADLAARVHRLSSAGRPVTAVVVTLGTTGHGAVDDLPAVLRLREECERTYGVSFRIHVDAAYGGYFRTVDEALLTPEVRAAFRALPLADSVTVDPHKCGRVPYPAGALVLRDRRAVRAVSTRPGPFGADGDGERLPFAPYTLEGARPGAAAAAVWTAHRIVGLDTGGYGRLLGGCLRAARALHEAFAAGDGPLVSRTAPDLAVVNLTTGSADSDREWSDRLRASGVSVSSTGGAETEVPGVRLCVMDPLAPGDLERLTRVLGETAAGALSRV
ncbi:pyridoxal phosphate-dependent decarboxylase family protein [Streptomyces purpureus]|uniref:pyridoxal phosphate-dependent decarboxylase family protein n=1 Tax=Streptomyces purpureus TaxID=1951 RepID=UPI00036CBA0A|nr:pyridoxal-dependent decarboxylase [Streptomyces purpureus]